MVGGRHESRWAFSRWGPRRRYVVAILAIALLSFLALVLAALLT
jgi:hypothetical protein